ncbi:hypothetical protein NA57DRAFT_77106 [Rhizodiscina lignyota]|uniref:Uncharacterized protein n=1 Tax=Rhizodiscina lignyota TaxID=1504668 RepID=A0A9P4IER9_9PEZI|nr:hypothetical protein NA57DRAFT_77106 [Rhizodiscina lignyota]
MFSSTLVLVALAASFTSVSAVCPGFNFAIGQNFDNAGLPSWNVYNDDCSIHEPITLWTDGNPCTSGIFSCTPDPITFNQYTDGRTGLIYACRTDPNSRTCGSDTIGVCCRNDGN